jgi:hypothetical protein
MNSKLLSILTFALESIIIFSFFVKDKYLTSEF